MPTAQVPIQPWTDIPALKKSKKFKRLAEEAVQLTKQMKYIAARRAELSLEMYDIMDASLDEQTKSVTYAVECADPDCPRVGEEHEHTATITKNKGRANSRLDKAALFSYPIPCSNPKCKTDNHVTADVYEACQKRGEDSRPSVSIKLEGDKADD